MRKTLPLLLLLLFLGGVSSSAAGPQQRIVGGHLADESWSSTVALIWKTDNPIPFSQGCGGTLVHPRWVATAAHCINNGKNNFLAVLAGTRDLRSGGEVIGIERGYYAPAIRVSKKRKIFNDLALLKLRRPSTAPTMPLLPKDLWSSEVQTGSPAETAGWGDQFEGSFWAARPMLLRSVEVEIMNTCQRAYPKDYRGIVDICAGVPEGGKDSCQGDSGGPLTKTVAEQKYLIGVVSRGQGCARKGYPGVYGKILPGINWIEGLIGV